MRKRDILICLRGNCDIKTLYLVQKQFVLNTVPLGDVIVWINPAPMDDVTACLAPPTDSTSLEKRMR